jgi:predicted RecB family nuclease
MASKITKDALEAYINCKLKAYLKIKGDQGSPSDYASMLAQTRQAVRINVTAGISSLHRPDEVLSGIRLNSSALHAGPLYVSDATFEDDIFSLAIDGLKRVDGPSALGSFHYVPVIFHEGHNVTAAQRLQLEVAGMILATVQGRQPENGIVWSGPDFKPHKVRLNRDPLSVRRQIREMKNLAESTTPPPLYLNRHCPVCEFRDRCRSEALQGENLSLLRGIGPKEIKRYARKGILTLTQLSHTFRPRRKGKRGTPDGHKRYHSLQAMAIRDRTIYVLGNLELPSRPTQIYFDIEGSLEEDFIYLIGVIVRSGNSLSRQSFWADDRRDERAVFETFLSTMAQHQDFVLCSYGSLEAKFLKRMQKHADLKVPVTRLLNAFVNVLSPIHAHIYFPTYSNSLKEVGRCLGCSWTEPDASGLQSVYWRGQWEQTGDDRWKQKLLRYNLEDCEALMAVCDRVHAIADGAQAGTCSPTSAEPLRIERVQDMDRQADTRKWGEVKFIHSDYAFINKCAYFNYQHERVYLHTNRTIRKNRAKSTSYRNRHLKVNWWADITASKCESCGSHDLIVCRSNPLTGHGPHRKRAFDLIPTRGGVKVSVVECRSHVYRCRACKAIFVPKTHRRLARYFHGVKGWAMYQHVAHGSSFGAIKDMLDVFFDLPVPKREVHRFKGELAHYYESTCRDLWRKLKSGNLLHVDETVIKLKGGQRGYVWAFTNLEEVLFMFRPNREGAFLRDLLDGFRGVLVSDFYAAYDSIGCAQQKCLIHLIRDMNDALLENPFDEELRGLTTRFGILLRAIVAEIGQCGLRRWHLRHFKKDVAEYFRIAAAQSPSSDAAQALRARLLKYQSTLFTFLDHDGVPWNNNNAENAIKRFAYYRAHASGMMKESGVSDFLTLLSLYQTCRYKGTSFWKYMLSRRRDVDGLADQNRTRPPVGLELYPEGYPSPWEKLWAKSAAQRSRE